MEKGMSSAAAEPRKLTTYELWYGRNEPPPQGTLLRAGSLTGVMEGGDLRDVRLGDIELVRRIYVAVRDEWDTIPAQIMDVSTAVREDRFVVSYDAEHSSRKLRFRWHATITGEQDGTITYTMAGHAQQDFSYCRIGCGLPRGQPCWGGGGAEKDSIDRPAQVKSNAKHASLWMKNFHLGQGPPLWAVLKQESGKGPARMEGGDGFWR